MNMSYCRFQNTASDLEDCRDELDDFDTLKEALQSMGTDERRAAMELIDACTAIAKSYSTAEIDLDELEDEDED